MELLYIDLLHHHHFITHKIAHCSRILRINYDMILAEKYCTQLWNWHWSKINRKYSNVRLMSMNTSSSVNVNKSQKEHRPRFILAVNLKFTCHGKILSNMVEFIKSLYLRHFDVKPCEKIRLDPLVLQLVLR